jgi:hypothetical protein
MNLSSLGKLHSNALDKRWPGKPKRAPRASIARPSQQTFYTTAGKRC